MGLITIEPIDTPRGSRPSTEYIAAPITSGNRVSMKAHPTERDVIARFFPFLTWLPLIGRATLKADLLAGFTGAVIVLPQAVAFAAIAGLPPEYGLYTAMVTPVVAALFGSSYHLISGPTTAISIVVFSAVSQYAEPGSGAYIGLALTLTFLAGFFQLAFGLARLGALVNFVSHTVVTGFTAGAAILIVTSQLKHVLGLTLPRGESFIDTWAAMATHFSTVNGFVVAVAAVTIGAAVVCRRFFPKAPNLLVGMVAGSLASLAMGGPEHGVALLGEIPSKLPPISVPEFSIPVIRQLAPDAFAIALLGLIEAVSISRSVAARSRQLIDGNQEFIGQGLSNLVGSFFSSYAGSGSFTRSGINYAAGAKTPLSAIFAAVALMALVLLIAPLTAWLPLASMGGVILIVAWNLIDFRHIRFILRVSPSESAILAVTFFSTLFLELEFAIYIGVFLSLILFLSRSSTPDIVIMAPDPATRSRQLTSIEKRPLHECPHMKIIRIDRSIYFGSVGSIRSRIEAMIEKERLTNMLIVSEGINYIDLAGAEMLVELSDVLKARGGGLYFCNLKTTVFQFIAHVGFIDRIGEDHIFEHKSEAIAAFVARRDEACRRECACRVFRECSGEKDS
ncbi:SulP family inorganic anion transporter [Desulfoluna butyratoxydans]|uniref:SulP family inorganic anion transporter n=1 Tax=Desulfoluna butyratoxydans TaxID=231438 RepID=UPI001C553782|nr:SulP family inorganic anion transporter [Desulfoluna butyratoxydans]